MAIQEGDVFRFALRQTLFGQTIINTFALRVEVTGTTDLELPYMAGLFEDGTGFFNLEDRLRDEIAQQQTNQVTHNEWQVQRVNRDPTALYLWPVLTNNVGTFTGDCETGNIGMSIERKGRGPGRRQRGRIALTGLATTKYSSGVFNTEALAEAAGVAQQLQGAIDLGAELGTIAMGYWAPASVTIKDEVVIENPAQFVRCYSAQCKREVRVQRSRTVGKGV